MKYNSESNRSFPNKVDISIFKDHHASTEALFLIQLDVRHSTHGHTRPYGSYIILRDKVGLNVLDLEERYIVSLVLVMYWHGGAPACLGTVSFAVAN
jgi:hypothetical protein